jgi:heat shock protein HslJ
MPRSEHSRLSFGARDFAAKFDCNSGGGRYRVGGPRLRFSDIRSTAIGCEYPEGGAPPSLGDALIRTRSYRLTGRRLLLLGKRGRTIVRLARRG